MSTNAEEDKILYRDEVYQLVGAAMEVRNTLGFGFLEAVYGEAYAIECGMRGIPLTIQSEISLTYKDRPLVKKYLADAVAFGKIMLELKALDALTAREDSQLLNYLKATGFRVGLLINFGHRERLEWKRMVF